MSAIRLVATDLDGTLLRHDGTVSDRTRQALQAAERAGLIVVFVTGRPPRWLDAVIEETGHIGVAVGANGAVVYDMHDGRTVSAHTLARELVVELGAELRAAFPRIGFAVEFGAAFAAEPGYLHGWDVNPSLDRNGRPMEPPVVGAFPDFVIEPCLKLLAQDRSVGADDLLAAAVALTGDRVSITHSSSYGLLEISAAGVTKATGLAEVAAMHGVPAAEVVAIGDMPNDVAMLEWAGRSYAVADAHPAAKAAADAVVGSNEEDAVAVLLEGLLTQAG